jgi:hypothetical protein
MSLLGIAIIGKSNEPLYLCDCTRLTTTGPTFGGDATTSTTAPLTDDDDSSDADADLFGFIQATASQGQRQSLPLERQFMMHAALDRLEELVGASKPDGTMPLRPQHHQRSSSSSSSNNNNSRSNNNLLSGNNAHWLGLLTVQDGDCAVYGHVVVATNLKFLALVQSSSLVDGGGSGAAGAGSSVSSKNVTTAAAVKKLLASLHDNYIDYLLNPFSKIRGPIDSPRFDAKVRETVARYEQEGKPAS